MKFLMLMLLVVSTSSFGADVGENMKSQCEKTISIERVNTEKSAISSEDESKEVKEESVQAE